MFVEDSDQPRPQGLLLIQNSGRRNPGQGCWNTPRIDCGVFCYVTHEVLSSVSRPCLVSCNPKALLKRNEAISLCLLDEIQTIFLSHFGSLGQGFVRPPFWTRRRPWGRGWIQTWKSAVSGILWRHRLWSITVQTMVNCGQFGHHVEWC